MRLALLCAAALLAAPVMADEVIASNGADSVRLSDSQCTSEKVLEQATPPVREKLRAAVATISGQSFTACWVVEGNMAHLVYEDGDQGLVPLTEFRKVG